MADQGKSAVFFQIEETLCGNSADSSRIFFESFAAQCWIKSQSMLTLNMLSRCAQVRHSFNCHGSHCSSSRKKKLGPRCASPSIATGRGVRVFVQLLVIVEFVCGEC